MYFCYILTSINARYIGNTYIGFTDNPLHRLRQHNGMIKGGAKYTLKRKPWEIVLVVSNFPNKILALKFEWAWQNPFKSTFLKEYIGDIEKEYIGVKNKKKAYSSISFKLKVLDCLLHSKVFDKIYLHIYVFNESEKINMQHSMKLIEKVKEDTFNDVIKAKKVVYDETVKAGDDDDEDEHKLYTDKCIICDEAIQGDNNEESEEDDKEYDKEKESDNNNNNKDENEKLYIVKCPSCKSMFHMLCLAESSIRNGNDAEKILIPKETMCLICTKSCKWGEWVKDVELDK